MLTRAFATLAAAAVLVTASVAAAQALVTERPPSELNRHLADSQITESSGLARSTYDRPLLWTHNDSGSGPRLYAVGKDGVTKATVTLSGADARDWEDIASGPGNSLWVADVGDNNKQRTSVQVYSVTEPKTLSSSMSVPATRFNLAYPDGKHNSEAIMVHPVTGRLYVVTKSQVGNAAIYQAPAKLSTSSVNTLTRLIAVPDKITGASFTPEGSAFVIGNYSMAWAYRDFTQPTAQFAKPSLQQSESLEVSRDGLAVFMGSEGSNSPVYKVAMPSTY